MTLEKCPLCPGMANVDRISGAPTFAGRRYYCAGCKTFEIGWFALENLHRVPEVRKESFRDLARRCDRVGGLAPRLIRAADGQLRVATIPTRPSW